MAIPTDPTRDELVEEALSAVGHRHIPQALRNQAYRWMEDIKNDIVKKEKRLISLMTQDILVLQQGRSEYSFPTDYGQSLTAVLLKGTKVGTATAGAATSIDLEAGVNITPGDLILITGGTGFTSATRRGQLKQMISQSGQTVTVDSAWTTNPSSDSTYQIITSSHHIPEDGI
ncbi:MAG: hypothetical protein ACXABY_29540, partial [Candidatus Thorarchaeota archaeon]